VQKQQFVQIFCCLNLFHPVDAGLAVMQLANSNSGRSGMKHFPIAAIRLFLFHDCFQQPLEAGRSASISAGYSHALEKIKVLAIRKLLIVSF